MAQRLRTSPQREQHRLEEKERRKRIGPRLVDKEKRRIKLLAQYGLTEQAFAGMLYRQSYVCAICLSPDWGRQGPHIDHDHITGAVRGLLCATCNIAIGMIGDDEASLYRAFDYVRKNGRGK